MIESHKQTMREKKERATNRQRKDRDTHKQTERER